MLAEFRQLPRVGGQALLVFGRVPEAHLAGFAAVLVDLRGVFAGLEAEVVELGLHGLREVLVQAAEVRVVHAAARCAAAADMELDAGVLEVPAHGRAERGGRLRHQAVPGGCDKHVVEQLLVVSALEQACVGVAPDIGLAQFAADG